MTFQPNLWDTIQTQTPYTHPIQKKPSESQAIGPTAPKPQRKDGGYSSSSISSPARTSLPPQSSSMSINGFIAWLCNCCTTTTANPLRRQAAEREASQKSDERSRRYSNQDRRESIPAQTKVILTDERTESLPVGPTGLGIIFETNESNDGSLRTNESLNRFIDTLMREDTSNAGLPPPPIDQNAPEQPALQPGNPCDLVTETAPGRSSSAQQRVVAVELEQPAQD